MPFFARNAGAFTPQQMDKQLLGLENQTPSKAQDAGEVFREQAKK
jgi:hypothetical protein